MYKINGTQFITQPTTGRWMPRDAIGIDGNGQAFYPATREYELKWELLDMDAANQLQSWFNNMNVTGTVVADLPVYGQSGTASGVMLYFPYSGCVLREPQFGDHFAMSHHQNVVLIVARIHT